MMPREERERRKRAGRRPLLYSPRGDEKKGENLISLA